MSCSDKLRSYSARRGIRVLADDETEDEPLLWLAARPVIVHYATAPAALRVTKVPAMPTSRKNRFRIGGGERRAQHLSNSRQLRCGKEHDFSVDGLSYTSGPILRGPLLPFRQFFEPCKERRSVDQLKPRWN
jgi:hypothetical protein